MTKIQGSVFAKGILTGLVALAELFTPELAHSIHHDETQPRTPSLARTKRLLCHLERSHIYPSRRREADLWTSRYAASLANVGRGDLLRLRFFSGLPVALAPSVDDETGIPVIQWRATLSHPTPGAHVIDAVMAQPAVRIGGDWTYSSVRFLFNGVHVRLAASCRISD